jgi:Ca2+-binding RTX toxin-like protein
MPISDSDIPAAADLAWLVDTIWYVPTPNLPATLVRTAGETSSVSLLQDQTVWRFTTAAGGYLIGEAATNLGGVWTYSSMLGSVTPTGSVALSFSSPSSLFAPDGRSISGTTQGGGVLTTLAGEPAFLMQMNTGNAEVGLAHWAYMVQATPTDAAWADLPGSVPRGIEEVFRVGGTANSTVTGIDATGGNLADLIMGSTRSDRLVGNGGADTLIGDQGRDKLMGGNGADVLSGGEESDDLNGGAGNDLLLGGAGGDRLVGGADADTLIGGASQDILFGDAGADAFVLDSPTIASRDRIQDFQVGVDRLVIDASEFGGGLAPGALPGSAFASNATGVAPNAAVRFIYETDTGFLWWDADGDGRGQVAVAQFIGTPALTAADIQIIA